MGERAKGWLAAALVLGWFVLGWREIWTLQVSGRFLDSGGRLFDVVTDLSV